MVFGMIIPIQNSADNLSPSFYLSWPAFGTHISHGRKHFFSSFELKVSFQVVFLTIVNRIICRPSKILWYLAGYVGKLSHPYTCGIWLATLANSVTEWSNLFSIHWIPPLHILFFNNIQFSIMQISKSISNVNTSACQRWRPGTNLYFITKQKTFFLVITVII